MSSCGKTADESRCHGCGIDNSPDFQISPHAPPHPDPYKGSERELFNNEQIMSNALHIPVAIRINGQTRRRSPGGTAANVPTCMIAPRECTHGRERGRNCLDRLENENDE
ncbi:hypothetical protein EVAR_36491_1 [Eumeta japonica]|uniref:Uncharacterized protein n=1 Tax=Eumeta variegata TaxID=151549 RepID=A0A4C1WW30_EUMVA|nr:hypothetical protein EVAR_36491_1 [Eumeta japonica]